MESAGAVMLVQPLIVVDLVERKGCSRKPSVLRRDRCSMGSVRSWQVQAADITEVAILPAFSLDKILLMVTTPSLTAIKSM